MPYAPLRRRRRPLREYRKAPQTPPDPDPDPDPDRTVNPHARKGVSRAQKKSRSFLQLFLLLFFNRIYADLSLVSAKTFESDSAFCGSKECVILADLNVQAGMEMGASLTNDDVAGFSNLSCVHLCAKALGVGVTAVACAGRTFMMSE